MVPFSIISWGNFALLSTYNGCNRYYRCYLDRLFRIILNLNPRFRPFTSSPAPTGDLKPNNIAKADRSHPTPARFFIIHLAYPCRIVIV